MKNPLRSIGLCGSLARCAAPAASDRRTADPAGFAANDRNDLSPAADAGRRRVALRGGARTVVRWALMTAVVLSTGSCRRAVERAQRNIRFQGVERVERQGLTGAAVDVRVTNDTGYKLVLKSAQIGVYYAGSKVGTVLLREGVEVPRRTTGSVRTLWRLKISDPLALYVLVRKVQAGDLSRVTFSYDVEGRGGPAPVRISRDDVPVSEFLRTFGLTVEDIKKYLK